MTNLVFQFSTLAGTMLVGFGQLGVTLPDAHKQAILQAVQTLAVPVGTFLIGLNTKRP